MRQVSCEVTQAFMLCGCGCDKIIQEVVHAGTLCTAIQRRSAAIKFLGVDLRPKESAESM